MKNPYFKGIILIVFLLISSLLYSQVNPNHHRVKGYYRKNGTYVKPHYRTNPNHTNRDNYSTRPNTNPYTGKKGYIKPDNKYYYPSTSSNRTYNNSSNSTYSNRSNYTYTYSQVKYNYNLGVSNAKVNYKTSSYNYLVPLIVTAIDPYYGLGTTITIDLFPPNYYRTSDRYYNKGYLKIARRKKIIASVIGFGLGLITHELIKDELTNNYY